MDRRDVITRLRSVEATLRARDVAALYLFGSYGRDEASSASDIDVFVDAGSEGFYDLSNFVGAYEDGLSNISAAISNGRRSACSDGGQQTSAPMIVDQTG